MNAADILAFGVSSMTGFVLGYGVAWMARESVTGGTGGQGGTGGKGGASSDGSPGSPGSVGSPGSAGSTGHSPRAGWRRFLRNGQTLLGVLLLMLVMTSAILSYRAATDQREAAAEQSRVAECQAKQNRAFTMAISARSQATRDSNGALVELFRAVSVPGATAVEKEKAYRDWLVAVDRVNTIQQENPLVPENC